MAFLLNDNVTANIEKIHGKNTRLNNKWRFENAWLSVQVLREES